MKAALAVTKKDSQIRRLMIGDDQVGIAVVVHVGNRDVVGKMAGGHRRTAGILKMPLAVAEQHREGFAAVIRDNQVGVAIVVDIGHGSPSWAVAGGDRNLIEARSVLCCARERQDEQNRGGSDRESHRCFPRALYYGDWIGCWSTG